MTHAARPRRLWPGTVRLGILASGVGILAAVLARELTPLPSIAIVVPLALAAFSASWREVERAADPHTDRPFGRRHMVTTIRRRLDPPPRPAPLRLVPPA